MCRVFLSVFNNHQFETASPSGQLLLKQRGDCIEVLEDGVSGGTIGELAYYIIELPGVRASVMEYLKEPVTETVPGPSSGILLNRIVEKRLYTTSISGLRDPMGPQDQRRFDRHPTYPVNPRTGLRESPRVSKTIFERQVFVRNPASGMQPRGQGRRRGINNGN